MKECNGGMNGMSRSKTEGTMELVLVEWWELQKEEGRAFCATGAILAKGRIVG